MTAPALTVRGMTVKYGTVKALDSVDIDVAAGTVAAVIGPNGAGKTTLLDAATGFIRHAIGTVTVDGRDVSALAPHKRARVGLRRTFQQCRTPEDLPAERYVRYAAGRKMSTSEVEDFLQIAGSVPRTVTLGELDVPTRRLVEFAGAAAALPKVLLLDEPAAGLGEHESVLLGEAILSLPKEYGITVLVVEHDMQLVRSICTSATVLDFGVELASGDTRTVLDDPRVQRAYLGAEEIDG